MKIEELGNILKEKGFTEEKMDSGYNYTLEAGHIKLICYIEPGMDVEFVSIYHWSNNDVKGTYNIPVNQLLGYNGQAITLFRKTKNNLPQRIGLTTDTHEELEHTLLKIFEEAEKPVFRGTP